MKIPFFGNRSTAIVEKTLQAPVPTRGGWLSIVSESFPGAWQQNVELRRDTILSYHAVYACMTLISSDMSKLALRVVKSDSKGVWAPAKYKTVNDLLRRPNSYQTTGQFIEYWTLSKLSTGNVYVLKERNASGAVVALHILDPGRCRPLVSDSGEIYYDLSSDNLADLQESKIVPASEVIHDRYNCIFHPLIGTAPIIASGLAAMQGNAIQNNSANLFRNASMPGGILTAPGAISDEVATRLKMGWEANFNGKNYGKVAVLGDGLTFNSMTTKATDAQMLEQLKWTAEVVCSTFHVPPYKIGVGQMPTFNNIQSLNIEYYSQCLQKLIEDIEAALDYGLDFPVGFGVEFDLEGLLRMDSSTLIVYLKEAVGAGIMAPNEGRSKLNLKPVTGGDTPYLQQQNYSLEALSERGSEGLVAPAPVVTEPTEQPESSAIPKEDNELEEAKNQIWMLKAFQSLQKGLRQ